MSEKEAMKKIKEDFKALKLDFIEKLIPTGDVNYIGVKVDMDTNVSYQSLIDNLSKDSLILEKLTKRNSRFYIDLDHEREGTLTFNIMTKVPNDVSEIYNIDYSTASNIRATTFPDLCWLHAEGTTNQTLDEINTKVREGVETGDLSWILPSRFVDDFVEIMHTLNQHDIFDGLLGDSIIYGPYFLKEDDVL